MQVILNPLILYPLLIFVFTLIFQVFLIERKENKEANKKGIDIEKGHKWNRKSIVKIIVALVISIFLAIITFYGLGFTILVGLQEGR